MNKQNIKRPTLYSYCIPIDDGAAPNPYWGICTLAICKPVIRRNAEIGDWVVGTGSKRYGMQNKVVYAMKVTEVVTLKKYNEICNEKYPNKIPDLEHSDIKRRAGDCIYFQSNGKLNQRKGVHDNKNYNTDTNGKNVLLSDHFYYFGNKPVELHPTLLPIVQQGQGHKSKSNAKYVTKFINWIEKHKKIKPFSNEHLGEPFLLKQTFAQRRLKHSATCRRNEGMEDEQNTHKC
jgi:hypothetical protein